MVHSVLSESPPSVGAESIPCNAAAPHTRCRTVDDFITSGVPGRTSRPTHASSALFALRIDVSRPDPACSRKRRLTPPCHPCAFGARGIPHRVAGQVRRIKFSHRDSVGRVDNSQIVAGRRRTPGPQDDLAHDRLLTPVIRRRARTVFSPGAALHRQTRSTRPAVGATGRIACTDLRSRHGLWIACFHAASLPSS